MKLGLGIGIGRRRRAVSIGPNFTVAPTISGTAEIGETLTRTTGTAVGTGVVTYVTEWQRDGVAIAAETGATYVLAAADDETTVRVKITATDDTGDRVAYASGVGVTYAAPVAANGIAAQLWEIGVAITPVDLSVDYTGDNISYSLISGPPGIAVSTIGSETGTPTDETFEFSMVVRGTNSGGSDDSTFLVTTSAVPVLSNLDLDTVPTPAVLSANTTEFGEAYYLVNTSATPLLGSDIADQVIAMTPLIYGNYTVTSGSITADVDLSSLADGTYYLHLTLLDDQGFFADDAVSGAIVVAAGGLTAPTFQSVGTFTAAITGISPPVPAHAADDILVCIAGWRGNDVTPTTLVSEGWAQMFAPFNSGSTASHRYIGMWWKRAVDGATAAPTLDDPGNMVAAAVLCIRGCKTTGDPFVRIGADTSGSGTSVTCPGGATGGDERLVMAAFTLALDSTTSDLISFANGDLTELATRLTGQSDQGAGCGVYAATGKRATSATIAATTASLTVGGIWPAATVAFIPVGG